MTIRNATGLCALAGALPDFQPGSLPALTTLHITEQNIRASIPITWGSDGILRNLTSLVLPKAG